MAGRSPSAAGNTALPVAVSLVSVFGVCSARRGIAWLNLVAVPSGLRGVPVGISSAKALRANGLSPFFSRSAPVAV